MTDLLAASVAQTTIRRYSTNLQQFIDWARTTSAAPQTYDALDSLVLRYFVHQYDVNSNRGNRQNCINTRCAVLLWLPNARGHLNASDRALDGWDRLQPKQERTPCPYFLCLLFIRHFYQQGNLALALLTYLCFDAYLRISEALSITLPDISLPSSEYPGGIRLPRTKTGTNQSVTISNPHLWNLFKEYLATIPESRTKIFSGINAAGVIRELDRATTSFGITAIRFTPHTLRHGGATEDFLKNVPIQDIVHRGRWASVSSAENYIQSGKALLLGTQLPNALKSQSAPLMRDPSLLFRR